MSLAEIYAAIAYALSNREEIAAEIEEEDRLERPAVLVQFPPVASLRFHLDEDCQATALASALLEHGMDVTTTNEAGLAGVGDEHQLQHASEQQRVLVTNNIRDFVPLHTRWLAEDVHRTQEL